MSGFDLWRRYLEAAAGALILSGLALAVFNQSAIADLLVNRFMDPVFFEDMPAEARAFQAWIYGVLGATMAGWGVCMLAIVRVPFARRQPWAWTTLVAGLALWYAVDTSLSALHGVWFNVAFNTAALAAAALPLVATRRSFDRALSGSHP